MGKFAISVALLLASMASFSQEGFFPRQVFSENSQADQFAADWYSAELRILQEPSLLQMTKTPAAESYRFLWLRTFHHPVAIRLDLRSDGTGILTTKVANGPAGFYYKDRHLLEDISRPLPRNQTQLFLGRLHNIDFWHLQGHVNDGTGNDGAEWIIEGVKNGSYRVVNRWSPREGAVRDLGLTFVFGLAQMAIPKDEVY